MVVADSGDGPGNQAETGRTACGNSDCDAQSSHRQELNAAGPGPDHSFFWSLVVVDFRSPAFKQGPVAGVARHQANKVTARTLANPASA